MRILIVEDEKVSQKKMEMIMSKYGMCKAVANGITAIEMFKKAWHEKAPFDLITLDITLHEMSGLDVLIEIREFEKEEKVPEAMRAKIIMVTAHSDHDHISTSVTIGADSYIVKPFSSESIANELRKVYLKHIEDFFPKT